MYYQEILSQRVPSLGVIWWFVMTFETQPWTPCALLSGSPGDQLGWAFSNVTISPSGSPVSRKVSLRASLSATRNAERGGNLQKLSAGDSRTTKTSATGVINVVTYLWVCPVISQLPWILSPVSWRCVEVMHLILVANYRPQLQLDCGPGSHRSINLWRQRHSLARRSANASTGVQNMPYIGV